MFDPYPFLKPILYKIDPETAHHLTLHVLKSGLFPKPAAVHNPVLESTLCGLKFPNPVGLSAGFDKNAEVVGAAFQMGFGFVEAGTVTPRPQHGNPKPRVFRDVENSAVINRMGFPNAGMTAFKPNLERFFASKERARGVVGINIGMNKSQTEPAKDYGILIRQLAPMADYITVNISSPNTPGLRDLQSREPFLDLIGSITEEREKTCGAHAPPLFVKLAPDLTEEKQEELAKAALESGIDGLILTNTTLARPDYLPETFRGQAGGLSGKPLTARSTEIIGNFYKLTGGKLPIIGVGGISTGQDAYDKIRAGASLVQLYSALVFRGPLMVSYVNDELAALLQRDGYRSVTEAIGVDIDLKT
jgi:dihydroorotate dehydrogenase